MNFFNNNIKKNKHIRIFITFIHPILFPVISFFSSYSIKLNTFIFYLLFKLDWGKIPRPEWMDHDQDTFYQFNSNGKFYHFERGIIPRLVSSNFFFKSGKLNILDLCSGDSYISQKFFFDMSKNIVSLDLDRKALDRGKKRIKRYQYLNNSHFFFVCDIEKCNILDFLKHKNIFFKFDIILFNAAIEHFKEDQLDLIFNSVKEVMNKKSFLSCYTIVEDKNDQQYLPEHHQMFFSSKEHLERVVYKYFKFTKSYHSLYNDRLNIYCIGSDQKLEI